MACPFSPPPGPRCCWRAVVRQLPWCAAIILPVLGSAAVAGNGCARADGMRRRTDDRSRPPWHRWYSPAAWTKLRSHQLTVEPLCRMCLAEGRTTAAPHPVVTLTCSAVARSRACVPPAIPASSNLRRAVATSICTGATPTASRCSTSGNYEPAQNAPRSAPSR
jgi:hypothetical protein